MLSWLAMIVIENVAEMAAHTGRPFELGAHSVPVHSSYAHAHAGVGQLGLLPGSSQQVPIGAH